MPYVDGFVLPVSRARLDEYRRLAESAAEIFKEHGALEYWECAGDDLRIEGMRSFVDMAGAADDETVVFAWVVYDSREARDAANAKIAADPRMAELMDPSNPPFDMTRMAYGGFGTLVRSS
ncbi:MAG: DUF1428 domain-containing protein [Acidobacteriota bacterium]